MCRLLVILMSIEIAVSQDLFLANYVYVNDTASAPGANCVDIPPAGGYSCAQQKGWGKCGESWMKGHCCKTCFNCQGSQCGGPGPRPPSPQPPPGPSCPDIAPKGIYSCSEQKAFGKCGASWMKGHCCKTCFNCYNCGSPSPPSPPSPGPSPPGPSCKDEKPPGKWSCTFQKTFGKCKESWMKGYCCKTCFNCQNCGSPSPSPGPSPRPSPSPPSPPVPWPAGNSLPGGLSGGSKAYRCGIEKPSSTRQKTQHDIMSAFRGDGGELAVVMAMAMIESDDMCSTDTSKGSSSGRSNWSPWNMNLDYLEKVGCDIGCARSLGQHCGSYNIGDALAYVLQGIRGDPAIGDICDFFHFHRYGETGWKDGKGKGCGYESSTCKGCSDYAKAVADGATQILQNHAYATEGYRVCEKVYHVR